MCVNYGGRTEIVDAVKRIAEEVQGKRININSITEKTLVKFMYNPQMSDVDLFLRTSGEERTSNFLPWQSVYAEMVFMDVLWPDVDRTTLWRAIEIYDQRERRFGKA
jgi:undecaprenyl diphosphate synthase